MSGDGSSAVQSGGLLQGLRVAFVGRLGGLTRKEAHQLVRLHGGQPVERPTAEIDLVIVGADELPGTFLDSDPATPWRTAIASEHVECIEETELWRRLGCMEVAPDCRRLFTPAMLADLLKVPVRNIRRWQRMGLIQPVQVVHRLPYFDFQQVQSARQVAHWIATGTKPSDLRKQLDQFARHFPNLSRSLSQLEILVEGRQVLLRKDEGLLEPAGQMRIDFDAIDETFNDSDALPHLIVATPGIGRDDLGNRQEAPWTSEQIIEQAQQQEDLGDFEGAIEWYRVHLSSHGPSAEIHFQLAELLYRTGDVTAARERYYAAIECDEDFVEARANLGCVLLETGRVDLAIAAFHGALAHHEAYADVHYHLARTLHDNAQKEDAIPHWQRFIELAPESPWAEEARSHLAERMHPEAAEEVQ
jgi:tetratricopeptide (TPR) repeat protein